MKTTPLHAAHLSLSAKMGEFAGYDMPLYYALGVLKEHEWVRSSAGLFDVSHMGQVSLKGEGTTAFLEKLTPSTFSTLGMNRAKYTVMTNPDGGIVDDLMVTRTAEEEYHLVINAGCKDKDIAWIKSHLPPSVEFTHYEDWALLALQGPQAEAVLRDVLGADLADVPYMTLWFRDYTMFISRLGYTGEDGFEISVPAADAEALWNKLLSDDRVKPIGLAARDSLRLEMGYCLYGHDIDATTTPLEADLAWVMGKGTNKSYIGVDKVVAPLRKRVGVMLTDKGVAREGSEVLDAAGVKIGVLTSGGYGPTLKASIGQAYLPLESAVDGTPLQVVVRGNPIAAKVAKMPFLVPKTKSMKKV